MTLDDEVHDARIEAGEEDEKTLYNQEFGK